MSLKIQGESHPQIEHKRAWNKLETNIINIGEEQQFHIEEHENFKALVN